METSNINISEIITETINTLFENLFSSIDNSLYSLLDDLTFIGDDFLKNSFLENILGSATKNGIILIANSILIGFILYYAISSFLAYILEQYLKQGIFLVSYHSFFTLLKICLSSE